MTGKPLAKSILFTALTFAVSCQFSRRQVVIHTSVDPAFAEPVFDEFTRRTGIEVRPVFGVEAAGLPGLLGRIAGEQDTSRPDVFWSAEFALTMLLKQRGLLAAHDSPGVKGLSPRFVDAERYWSGVGARCRVLLVQARLAPPGTRASLESLLNPEIPSSRVGIPFPPSGTAAAHAAALYALQGDDSARWFFQRLRARGVRVLDSNDAVRKQVLGWQLAVGLTDSDAGCNAVTKDGPVAVVLPDQETIGTFLIPSTVALLKGAPHPNEGKRMIDFLLSAENEERLIKAGFFQFSLRDVEKPRGCLEGRTPRFMNVSLEDVSRRYEASRADMERIFVQ